MMEYVRSTSLLAPPPPAFGLSSAHFPSASAPCFTSASVPSFPSTSVSCFPSASAPFTSGPNGETATANQNLDHLEASSRFSFVDPVTAIIFQDASHQNSHSPAPAVLPSLLPDLPLPHSHISSDLSTTTTAVAGAAAAADDDQAGLDGESSRLILRNVQSLAGTQSSSKKLIIYR